VALPENPLDRFINPEPSKRRFVATGPHQTRSHRRIREHVNERDGEKCSDLLERVFAVLGSSTARPDCQSTAFHKRAGDQGDADNFALSVRRATSAKGAYSPIVASGRAPISGNQGKGIVLVAGKRGVLGVAPRVPEAPLAGRVSHAGPPVML
jgi:hypothetical protein